MKKLLILALALVMALTVSFGVFAGEIIGGNTGANALSDPADINVTVDVNTPTVSTVYRVDIAWDNVAFNYTPAYNKDWNPNNLAYEGPVDAVWSNNGIANITVTNRSNDNVAVSAKATAGNAGVDFTFTEGSQTPTTLGRADADAIGGNASNLNKVTYTLTIDQNDTSVSTGTIATIDITLG